MKFPSIVRLPRNKSFEYTPRHYDPIKEEIEERTDRIRREMKAEGLLDAEEDQKGEHASRRSSATIQFQRKQRSNNHTSLLQLLMAAILGCVVVGWLFFGNVIFYSLLLILPFYVYFRFKNFFGKGN